MGIRHAARKHGGEDCELTFGKSEMPGYHTGPAARIGFFIGARHSHLDNAGYSVDQKQLIVQGDSYTGNNGIGAGFGGLDITEEGLKHLGSEIHREKYEFKYRDGLTFTSTHLPKRVVKTPSPVGRLAEEYIRKAIRHFEEIDNSA